MGISSNAVRRWCRSAFGIRLGGALALLISVATPSASQEVTLPLESYEALRHRASPPPAPAPAPPAPFTIEASELTIRAAAASARVTQRLTLSLYAEDFVTVPLPDSGSVTSVELGTLEGRIATEGGRALVVRGRGRHVVTLEGVVSLDLDAESARESRTLSLGLPRAGVVTGTVVGAEDLDEILILAGGVARPRPDATDFLFVGEPGASLKLRLLGEERGVDRAGLPLVFEALTATISNLGRNRLRATAYIDVEVVQGRLEELRVSIPPGLDVVRSSDAGVGWRRDGNAVVLTPSAPQEGRFRVTLDLEGEPLAEVVSPLVVPESAARTTLMTAFVVEGDGIPTLVDPGAGRRADAYELERVPGPFRAAGAFVVSDPERAPRWSVAWSDAAQTGVLALQIDRLAVEVVVGTSGQAGYQCWAYVRSSGATSVALRLPPGFELVKASRDGLELVPGVTESGLEVPLGGTSETQVVFLAGVLPLVAAPESERFEIPVPSASAPVAQAAIRAILPGDHRYVVADGHVDPVVRTADTPFSFVVPAGFALVEASWTALSNQPRPLVLEVEPIKRDAKWF